MKKEKITIKESVQRIIFILSVLNLFLLFPFTIEGIGLSLMFREESFIGNYKKNIIILIMYGILSVVTVVLFYIDRKNKGRNLIRNLSILLIFIALFLIIYGIINTYIAL